MLKALFDVCAVLKYITGLDDLDGEQGRTPHRRVFLEDLTVVFDPEAMEKFASGPLRS